MASPKATFTITAVDRTKKAFDSVNKNLAAVGKKAGVVGAVVGAAFAATIGPIKKAADEALKFGDVVDLLGLTSSESLQRIAQAGEEVGVTFETTAMATQRLARRAQEAAEGNEQLLEAFDAFGLSMRDLQSLAPDELIERMADGQARAAETGQDLAQAARILDSEGLRLLRTFKQLNSEGFEEGWRQMEQWGATLDEETIEKAQQLRQVFERVTNSLAARATKFAVDVGFSILEVFGIVEEELEKQEIVIDDRLQRQAERHTQAVMDEEARELEKYRRLELMADQHFASMMDKEQRHVDQISDDLAAEERMRQRSAQNLLSQAARNSKLFFEIDKARAIASTALSAREAIMNAYTWGMKIGGPGLAAAFAAAAGAATAVQIAALASTQYGTGGGGVATGGPGGESATPSEITGQAQPRQTINVEFAGGTGIYDENSIRQLIDLINEVNEDGSESLSGRFTVEQG